MLDLYEQKTKQRSYIADNSGKRHEIFGDLTLSDINLLWVF
jgi:hypothetical protein